MGVLTADQVDVTAPADSLKAGMDKYNAHSHVSQITSGAGPFSFGGATAAGVQVSILGSFTPASGTVTRGLALTSTLTPFAAAGDIIGLYLAPTLVEFSSGVHALIAGLQIAPTITAGAATVTTLAALATGALTAQTGTTNAAAIYVSAAPTGATNNYPLWVDAGASRFDGGFDLSAGAQTVSLANVADALNFDSNTLSIDALNNRIGIGTAGPGVKLEVSGDIGLSSGATRTISILGNANPGADLIIQAQNTDAYTGVPGNLYLRAGQPASSAVQDTSGRHVYIDGSNRYLNGVYGNVLLQTQYGGNVGVNRTVPGAQLDVLARAAGTIGLIVDSAATPSANSQEWRINGAAATTYLTSTLTMRLGAYGAGTATFDANGLISSVSDERLKTDIRPLPYGLAEVLRLTPIAYRWRPESGLDSEGEYGGFGALQVEAIMPLAVGRDPQGYRTLADRPILGALVHSVQALYGQDQEVRGLLQALQERMGTMETRLN